MKANMQQGNGKRRPRKLTVAPPEHRGNGAWQDASCGKQECEERAPIQVELRGGWMFWLRDHWRVWVPLAGTAVAALVGYIMAYGSGASAITEFKTDMKVRMSAVETKVDGAVTAVTNQVSRILGRLDQMDRTGAASGAQPVRLVVTPWGSALMPADTTAAKDPASGP